MLFHDFKVILHVAKPTPKNTCPHGARRILEASPKHCLQPASEYSARRCILGASLRMPLDRQSSDEEKYVRHNINSPLEPKRQREEGRAGPLSYQASWPNPHGQPWLAMGFGPLD